MPFLRLQTNLEIDEATGNALCRHLSIRIADWLGKPERYVMVAIEPRPRAMCFAGDDGPCAYLELKSLGLPDDRTGELSRLICETLEERLGIDASRVYIEFGSPPRHHWGWNRSTF